MDLTLDKLEKLADQVAAITQNQVVSAEAVAIVRAYSAELNPGLIKGLINCARAVEAVTKTAVPDTDGKTYQVTKGSFLDCQDSHYELDKVLLSMRSQSKIVTPKTN